MTESDIMRSIEAGLLGKYYAARHASGQYRSSAVTARYNFVHAEYEFCLSSPHLYLESLLKYALWRTIDCQPSLCYGVLEETVFSESRFVQIPRIHWDDVLCYTYHGSLPYPQEESSGYDADAELEMKLGDAHRQLWTDQVRKPAWKVIVLKHPIARPNWTLDVIFLSHHAIADGLSGTAFHRTFLEKVQEAVQSIKKDCKWPFIVPPTTTWPKPVEGFLKFPSDPDPASINDLETSIFNSSKEVWTSKPPRLHGRSYITKVLLITISATQLAIINSVRKRLNVTITGLLHGLLVAEIRRCLGGSFALRAVTPYALRRFTNVSSDEICNHISYITSTWSCEDRSPGSLEDRLSGPVLEEEALVAKIAAKYQDQLRTELARVPEHGCPSLIQISKIEDLEEYCREEMKKPRECTYELSNLGQVKLRREDEGGGPSQRQTGEALSLGTIQLEKLVFTQCGMVVGPAIGCSVVSVEGGPLVISLTWQGGVVPGLFMQSLRDSLDKRLNDMKI